MRKQGSLRGIILLVISFSVINYVVSKSVRLRQADTLFFCVTKKDIIDKKRVSFFRPKLPRSGAKDCPSGAKTAEIAPQ